MTRRFDQTDEGKPVVTPSGDVVGRVTRTRDGAAFVTPTWGTLAGYGARLGNAWDERQDYRLDETEVDSVVDEGVVLKEVEARSESREIRKTR